MTTLHKTPFLSCVLASLYHKWNSTELSSPETQWLLTALYYDLWKVGNLWKISKLFRTSSNMKLFAKTSILDVWQGYEYAPDKTYLYVKNGLVLFYGKRLHTTDTVKYFGDKTNEDLDFKYCCISKYNECFYAKSEKCKIDFCKIWVLVLSQVDFEKLQQTDLWVCGRVWSSGPKCRPIVWMFSFEIFLGLNIFIAAGNYTFKLNNKNTRTRCEICSKLTTKTSERRQAWFWCLYC